MEGLLQVGYTRVQLTAAQVTWVSSSLMAVPGLHVRTQINFCSIVMISYAIWRFFVFQLGVSARLLVVSVLSSLGSTKKFQSFSK